MRGCGGFRPMNGGFPGISEKSYEKHHYARLSENGTESTTIHHNRDHWARLPQPPGRAEAIVKTEARITDRRRPRRRTS